MLHRYIVVLAALAGLFGSALADEPKVKTFTDPAKAGPDFLIQGEYEGRIGKERVAGLQVIALGDGKFDAVLFPKGLPGTGSENTRIALKGETKDGRLSLAGEKCSGEIKDGTFTGSCEDAELKLKRIERQSPTLGAKPPAGAIVLFDGSTTDEWQNGRIQEGNLLGVGTRTKRAFKNYTLHVEFRLPYMPYDRGQGRSNSGLVDRCMYF